MSLSALQAWTNQGSQRGSPKGGDTTSPQGQGTMTAALSNAGVATAVGGSLNNPPGPVMLPNLHGLAAFEPVPVWIALVVVYFVLHYAQRHRGVGTADIAGRRLSVRNIGITTLEALIGFTFLKWVFGYWKFPGISPLVLAA